jgi:hypothetical protein
MRSTADGMIRPSFSTNLDASVSRKDILVVTLLSKFTEGVGVMWKSSVLMTSSEKVTCAGSKLL